MANAYTDTSGSSLGTSLVQAAYDRYVEMSLRPQTLIRAVADKRPVQVDKPGSSVTLQTYNDLAVVSAALTETTDPDAVAVGNTDSVSITLNEYGNAALVTRKLELFSLSDVDPAIADIIAYNMADSLDGLALTQLRGGSNVFRSDVGAYSTQALASLAAGDDFSAAIARRAVTELRARNALPRRGELFWAGIHPRVSADLREESGAGGWRVPHEYNSNSNIWAGEVGTFEGAFYVESNRLYKATDGAASATVFRTIFAGAQALAEAVAEEPHTVIGPVTDKLMRFRPIGWYGVLGWGRFREECIQRVETTASSEA
jgi:N4-gp56 family major capsid protein